MGAQVAGDSGWVELLDGLTLIASQAAAAILAVPRPDLQQREKPDTSPVTAADHASEAIILDGLKRLLPNVPIVSEEMTGNTTVEGLGQRFLLVDPLDGTREFLAGTDEYAVCIALIEDGKPTLGVLGAPARGVIWRGHVGDGAERLALPAGAAPAAARKRVAIHTRACPSSGARVLVSRSHLDPTTEAYVDRLKQPQRVSCGSAVKFGLLAEGSADLYPRFGQTSEWDIAAGHAVLAAAGGAVRKPDGGAMEYGQPNFRVSGFIAVGDPAVR
jgi:3'(2'), 5'-bisphosphate nucleotidase